MSCHLAACSPAGEARVLFLLEVPGAAEQASIRGEGSMQPGGSDEENALPEAQANL